MNNVARGLFDIRIDMCKANAFIEFLLLSQWLSFLQQALTGPNSYSAQRRVCQPRRWISRSSAQWIWKANASTSTKTGTVLTTVCHNTRSFVQLSVWVRVWRGRGWVAWQNRYSAMIIFPGPSKGHLKQILCLTHFWSVTATSGWTVGRYAHLSYRYPNILPGRIH